MIRSFGTGVFSRQQTFITILEWASSNGLDSIQSHVVSILVSEETKRQHMFIHICLHAHSPALPLFKSSWWEREDAETRMAIMWQIPPLSNHYKAGWRASLRLLCTCSNTHLFWRNSNTHLDYCAQWWSGGLHSCCCRSQVKHKRFVVARNNAHITFRSA
jgi:hypothetical protein